MTDRMFEPAAFDPVFEPEHYKALGAECPNCSHNIEPILFTKLLGFCLGNVVKYVLRADHKGKPLEDLRKARNYLDIEIDYREKVAARARASSGVIHAHSIMVGEVVLR